MWDKIWSMEARNKSSEIFLTVDDFDVKYVGNEHVIHLVDALQQYFKNFHWLWRSSIFRVNLGLGLQQRNHRYQHARTHAKDLARFPKPPTQKSRRCTFKLDTKKYRARVPFAKEEDGTPSLSEAVIKLQKKWLGIILFFGRYVYMTLLVALSTLESTQYHGT